MKRNAWLFAAFVLTCGFALGATAQAPPRTPSEGGPAQAANDAPRFVFSTNPPADAEGYISGRSPLEVTFNMCRSSDADDALRFTFDFDGDGSIDFSGTCRGSWTYSQLQNGCLDGKPKVCASERRATGAHTECREYTVCIQRKEEPPPPGAQAVSFPTLGTVFTNGAWSLGWSFTVGSDPVTVTALGSFDDGGNGFRDGSQHCGIFDSLGNLLVDAVVSSGDTLIGDFRYANVKPLTLSAGATYVAACTTGTDNYTFDPPSLTVDPRISFVQSRYLASATLVFPTDFDADIGYFGPSFLLQ
jgi:hypothetical protein